MLTILDKYIVREVLLAMLGVMLVLLIILLGNTTTRVLSKIVEGSLPSSALLPFVTINMVHYTTILLPLCIYLGILLALGRLYKDSEMSALSACGVGTKQLYRPMTFIIAPTVLLSALLSLYGSPWVSTVKQSIQHQAEQRSELSSIVAGRFNAANGGDSTLFVEALSEDRAFMENVFLQTNRKRSEKGAFIVETAKSGYQFAPKNKDIRFMIFNDGYLHSVSQQDRSMRLIEFEEHGVEIREESETALDLKTSAVSSLELWYSSDPKMMAELQWRISAPVACLLLAILALPLSYTTPRKGRYSKLALGILIYLVYTNLLGISRGLIEKQLVPEYVGMSWPHLVLLIVIGIILRYQTIMMGANKWRLFWASKPRLNK